MVEPTRTPQPQQPLFCTDVPIRGFGKVWSAYKEVKATLGCADSWQGGEQATQTAVQIFENGVMVWLQSDGFYNSDPVYVFLPMALISALAIWGRLIRSRWNLCPQAFSRWAISSAKFTGKGPGRR
ncbi:MAG: hypothetical protein HC875_28805 [Anaerolineales bacterium]|nr:hypothetical protein [Anaerolineales bacterium]